MVLNLFHLSFSELRYKKEISLILVWDTAMNLEEIMEITSSQIPCSIMERTVLGD